MGGALGALSLVLSAGAEPPRTWHNVPDDEKYDYWRPTPDDWGRPASRDFDAYFWEDQYWGPYDAQSDWYGAPYNDQSSYRYYESSFNARYPMDRSQRGYFFYTDDWHADDSRFDSWYDSWGL